MQVACILGESQMDLVSVVCGLLHDTVEDTALTLAELEVFVVVVTKPLARNMWPTGEGLVRPLVYRLSTGLLQAKALVYRLTTG